MASSLALSSVSTPAEDLVAGSIRQPNTPGTNSQVGLLDLRDSFTNFPQAATGAIVESNTNAMGSGISQDKMRRVVHEATPAIQIQNLVGDDLNHSNTRFSCTSNRMSTT